ncbi:MAG: hypothetical protein JWR50_3633 [Mucilaginibacter sp.]|nr:hypothetical protein [Mucilaginibacter sp.]
MNLIKIYFGIQKELSAEGPLKDIMRDVMREEYKRDTSTYIHEANSRIENYDEVKRIAYEIVNDTNVKYNDISITSKIAPEPHQEDWIIDGTPRHIFDMVINAKSIVYNCFQVMDINRFICIDPITNEVIQIITDHEIKIFVNK